MNDTNGTLRNAFIEDHRHLTRGLNQLLKALRKGDLETAARVADEVDRVAGPHIQFEEEVLYPEISRSRGTDFTDRLYAEHGRALKAIRALLSANGSTVSKSTLTHLIADVESGLDHAVSCGTLLSHVTTLPDGLQDRMLGRLMELRETGRRWSDL